MDHNKVKLTDETGRHTVTAEVSWNQKAKDDRAVRLTVGTNEVVIPFDEIYSLVYLMSTPEETDGLVPVKKTLVKQIVKMHIVDAKKNIKKGEQIRFRCETNVPVEVVEGLKRDVMGGRFNSPKQRSSIITV